MRLWILFVVALIGATIVECGRSSSSKRRKDKSRSETVVDSSNEDEITTGSRKQKEDDDRREHEDRGEHEREHLGGEKKKKDSSSSSEEDDKDGKDAKNETVAAKPEKSLLRLRRTQTDAKVEVKIDEHTRARRRRYELAHGRRVTHRRRRQDLTRAQELNDGVQRPLSQEAKKAKENRPTVSPPERHRRQLHSSSSARHRSSRMIPFRPKYFKNRNRDQHWTKIHGANGEEPSLRRFVRLGYAARHMNKDHWFQ